MTQHDEDGTMKVGVVFSQADSGTDGAAIRAWAQRAEAGGFAHILAYDHILGASVERLGPGPFGAFPAAPYTSAHTFHEILTLFSHLAAITTTIELGPACWCSRSGRPRGRQADRHDRPAEWRTGAGGGRMRVERRGGRGPRRRLRRTDGRLEEQIALMRRLWSEP